MSALTADQMFVLREAWDFVRESAPVVAERQDVKVRDVGGVMVVVHPAERAVYVPEPQTDQEWDEAEPAYFEHAPDRVKVRVILTEARTQKRWQWESTYTLQLIAHVMAGDAIFAHGVDRDLTRSLRQQTA